MPVKSRAKKSPKKKPSPKASQDQLSLDDAIVALQKTFSRVSAKTAEVDQMDARAMVSGQVNFDMSLKVHPERDYLYLDANGSVDLRLTGMIDTDVRTIDEDEPQ